MLKLSRCRAAGITHSNRHSREMDNPRSLAEFFTGVDHQLSNSEEIYFERRVRSLSDAHDSQTTRWDVSRETDQSVWRWSVLHGVASLNPSHHSLRWQFLPSDHPSDYAPNRGRPTLKPYDAVVARVSSRHSRRNSQRTEVFSVDPRLLRPGILEDLPRLACSSTY